MTSAPAGWYANGPEWETWWDGEQWSEHHRPRGEGVTPQGGERDAHAPELNATSTDPESSAPSDEAPTVDPAAAPTSLAIIGVTIERDESGLTFIPTGWTGRGVLESKTPVTVTWDQLLLLEPRGGGTTLRVQWGPKPLSFGVPNKVGPQLRPFITAALEQQYAATGRSAGTGKKLSRTERAGLLAEGNGRALEQRLPALEEALLAGDIHEEVRLTTELTAWAERHKHSGGEAQVLAAVAELRERHGIPEPKVIGRFASIWVYEDRLIRHGEGHPIDEHTEAQVFIDGQKQVTTRASLGAALGGFWLPGSALLPALAQPKKVVHDERSASYTVGSTGWTWAGMVPPKAVPALRAVAQRINAMAAAKQVALEQAGVPQPSAPPDLLTQLERVAALEADGTISAEQAAAIKDSLIKAL